MQISAELSLYPLRPDHDEYILSFIRRLHDCQGLKVYTNEMSTQINGEYDAVMDALKNVVKPTFEESGMSSLVIKILSKDIEPGQEVKL